MNLVIVESPAKATTISKYLNKNPNLSRFGKFHVIASMGHVRDLSKDGLGIDIEHDFTPSYRITPEKEKTVAEIKKHAKQSGMVWLASDFDREGEAIAMHVKEVLGLKKYHRITFTEITPKALEEAILHPRKIDEDLVDAQETRRILDRLVGFKLSPLLWKKYTTGTFGGLSAGRVQSAVLHIIVQKEKDIAAFTSSPYWHVHADMLLAGSPLSETKLYEDGTVYKCTDQKAIKGLLAHIQKKPQAFAITETKERVSRTNPDLPFTTSSLQQEASSKYGYTLKKTMSIAQELYEKGHITYMRTDSYTIADDFKAKALQYIHRVYGEDYVGSGAGSSKRALKKQHAQEAHEAIRPTNIEVTSVDISPDCKKLYDMIWKRTAAYFMSACIKEHLDIKITHTSFAKSLYFQSTYTKVKFNGYMIVYGIQNEKYDFKKIIATTQKSNALVCNSITAKQTWQTPPQRYTESSIIKVLESEGIGRPSTYASIMGKILEKQYVVKKDVNGVNKEVVDYIMKDGVITEHKNVVQLGQERSKLVPTEIGINIDAFLCEFFPYITDKTFTATMENDLDKIAEGNTTKSRVLNVFWKRFGTDVHDVQTSLKGNAKEVLKTKSHTLLVDGVSYTVRHAKYGPVIEGPEKKFIGLKPFMKQFKKEMADITADDIRFLTRLPMHIAQVRGSPFLFAYGPYGFYGKYKDANVKLPYAVVQSIIKEGTIDIKALEKAIDYKKDNNTSGETKTTRQQKPKK